MPRLIAKSSAFGQWVKQSRRTSGKTQAELAVAADLTQQLWSKIENQGYVPPDSELEKLCKALGRPISEARKMVHESATFDSRVRNFELAYSSLKRELIERAQKTRVQPLQVMVIRDDQEPIDEISVREHFELLSPPGRIELTVLFRSSDVAVWETFVDLARALETKWRNENLNIDDLRGKLAGYHRHGRHLEERDPQKTIPLPHPVMLVVDEAFMMMYSLDVHADVLKRQTQAGLDTSLAHFQSTMLWPGTLEMAGLFRIWVGARHRSDLPSERWKKINWLDSPES